MTTRVRIPRGSEAFPPLGVVNAPEEIPAGCFGVLASDPQTGALLDRRLEWAPRGEAFVPIFASFAAAQTYARWRARSARGASLMVLDAWGACTRVPPSGVA